MLIAAPARVIGAFVPFWTCTVTRMAGPAMLPGPFAFPWIPWIEVSRTATPSLSDAGEFSGPSVAAEGNWVASLVGPVGVGVGGFWMTRVSLTVPVEAA